VTKKALPLTWAGLQSPEESQPIVKNLEMYYRAKAYADRQKPIPTGSFDIIRADTSDN
jgi:hypothetical protein